MSPQECVGKRLFDLQPTGSDIPLRACQWAVARAESVLKETLRLADLEAQGSRLSVPLLLLASTRTKKVFRWPNAHRWFVANELLGCLRDETIDRSLRRQRAQHGVASNSRSEPTRFDAVSSVGSLV